MIAKFTYVPHKHVPLLYSLGVFLVVRLVASQRPDPTAFLAQLFASNMYRAPSMALALPSISANSGSPPRRPSSAFQAEASQFGALSDRKKGGGQLERTQAHANVKFAPSPVASGALDAMDIRRAASIATSETPLPEQSPLGSKADGQTDGPQPARGASPTAPARAASPRLGGDGNEQEEEEEEARMLIEEERQREIDQEVDNSGSDAEADK